MNINHLKQFIEVVESGSIRKAANKLYISESSISYTIKVLENYYDTKLFERDGGKLIVNKYGQALFEYAKSCIMSDEYIKKRLAEIKENEKQKINIAVYSHYFLNFSSEPIKRNCKNYRVDFSVMDEDTAVSSLSSNTIDAAILLDPPIYSDFREISVFKEQLQITILTTNTLVSHHSVTVDDIRNNKFFYVFNSDVYSQWVKELLRSNGIPFDQIIEMPMIERLDIKSDNTYCGFTTNYLSSFIPFPANTVIIPVNDPLATKRIKLCFKQENREKISTLIDYLTRHGRELAGNPLFLSSLIDVYGDR